MGQGVGWGEVPKPSRGGLGWKRALLMAMDERGLLPRRFGFGVVLLHLPHPFCWVDEGSGLALCCASGRKGQRAMGWSHPNVKGVGVLDSSSTFCWCLLGDISDLARGKTRQRLLTWHEVAGSQLLSETLCFCKGPTQKCRHPMPCTPSQQQGVTQRAKASG